MNVQPTMSNLCVVSVLAIVAICPDPSLAQEAKSHPSPGSEAVQFLEPGKFQTRSQGTREPVTYRFEAQNGQAYLVELEQLGLDFHVTIEQPGGKTRTFNSPLKRDERELIVVIPEQSGEVRITVNSGENTYAKGRYKLRYSSMPDDTAEERQFAHGLQLMTGASEAYDPEDRESSLQSLSAYSRASEVWRDLGRDRELAQSLYSEAMLQYWIAYDWSRSAKLADSAAGLYEKLGQENLYANAKMLQGVALIEAANEMEREAAVEAFENALALLEHVARIYESVDDEFGLALNKNNLGLTRYYMGDWDIARTLWEEAAVQFSNLGEWREELLARQNVAVIDGQRGYNARAIQTLEYMLEVLPEGSDPLFKVILLDNLAENQRRYGNYEEALQNHTAARTLHRQLDDDIGEAYSLTGIGNTYFSIGEMDLAERHLKLALPLAEAANDGRSQEAILSRLGDIKYLKAEYSEALDLHSAAADLASGEALQARRKLSVAMDLKELSRHDEALNLAGEAATLAGIAQSPATHADAMLQLGRIELARKNPQAAKLHFENALTSYKSLGLKGGQADAYDGLAMTARAAGDLEAAIEFGRFALDLNESLRERVASPELRAHYSAASHRYFESLIDMEMALAGAKPGRKDRLTRSALATSESARARLTIDLLRSASVNLRSRADPVLLAEERAMFEELSARAQQRDRLLRRGIQTSDDQQNLTELDQSMTDIENRLNVLSSTLYGGDPVYGSLSQSMALKAHGIQEALDEDSVLLQYAIGEQKSFAWAVTRNSVTAIEFAGEAAIQSLAMRIIDGLRSPSIDPFDIDRLNQDLAELAQYILHPLTSQLEGKRRVLISPDSVLEYIPFGALPIGTEPDSRALIETHEIVTVPSMSVVAALRSRGEPKNTDTMAIFADPIVDAADPRLPGGSAADVVEPNDSDIAMVRSSAELKRLPSTGFEARTIAALLPQSDVHLALGFEANLDQVLLTDLTPFSYLHFATHGVVDSRYPALSSLVLSGYSPDGASRDGMLRLYEIFDLELDARLVVLSACDTALGRQIRGEGLIGLAQGFMYAGARSVVASLWQVSDRATAELMSRFYESMLDHENPLLPTTALRTAQLELANSRRWSHPYYWSAFVLLGDWL